MLSKIVLENKIDKRDAKCIQTVSLVLFHHKIIRTHVLHVFGSSCVRLETVIIHQVDQQHQHQGLHTNKSDKLERWQ